jgi:hypothetical protein
MSTTTTNDRSNGTPEYDVIFVGAGFGTITTFHRYVAHSWTFLPLCFPHSPMGCWMLGLGRFPPVPTDLARSEIYIIQVLTMQTSETRFELSDL